MKRLDVSISYCEYDGTEGLSETDKKLINKAVDTASKAYAPYSGFHVGAALLLENGEIVLGSNQENSAYPSGLCAERTAIFYANSSFPDVAIDTIVILAEKNSLILEDIVTPCGACRQVILESEIRQKSNIRVLLASKNKVLVFDSIKQLLPFSFDGDLLNR
ncbi:MAG: cytidine deaminase [Bacteroidales bacterium]|jgi:cytidine deaminase|nr:cytidine deaminase [Bacteroidales bacterium]